MNGKQPYRTLPDGSLMPTSERRSVTTPQRCTEPHDCGRYLPHHAECCPCAQGMSERWADAANRLLNVVEAATDLLWKATQYGTTEDGDTAAYLLPKGTVHRLIGAVQGAGFPASFRADPGVSSFDEYLAKYRPDEFDKQRLDAMTPEERTREGILRAVRDLSQQQPVTTYGAVADGNAPSETSSK